LYSSYWMTGQQMSQHASTSFWSSNIIRISFLTMTKPILWLWSSLEMNMSGDFESTNTKKYMIESQTWCICSFTINSDTCFVRSACCLVKHTLSKTSINVGCRLECTAYYWVLTEMRRKCWRDCTGLHLSGSSSSTGRFIVYTRVTTAPSHTQLDITYFYQPLLYTAVHKTRRFYLCP